MRWGIGLLATLALAAPAYGQRLNLKQARHALATPGVTVTHDCERARSNVVGCWTEWEGALEIEPGSGNHARFFMWALRCGRHIQVQPALVGEPPGCYRGK